MAVPVIFYVVSLILIALGILCFFYNKINKPIRWIFVILAFISLELNIEIPFCAYETSMQNPGGSIAVCGTSFSWLIAGIIIGIPLMIVLFKYKIKKE